MFLIKPRDIPFIDILSCRLSFNGFSISRSSNLCSRNDVSQYNPVPTWQALWHEYSTNPRPHFRGVKQRTADSRQK